MARTIFGEARGESTNGQVAVAWVIRNRADQPSWWGRTITEVCRKPFQFSCWDPGDPNLHVIQAASESDPHFLKALGVAALVILRELSDPTGGATHYVATSIEPPDWTKQLVPTAHIGGHQFYREP